MFPRFATATEQDEGIFGGHRDSFGAAKMTAGEKPSRKEKAAIGGGLFLSFSLLSEYQMERLILPNILGYPGA
jgi:hypothetical protein